MGPSPWTVASLLARPHARSTTDHAVPRDRRQKTHTMLAIDILRWPGFNQAFIVSFVVTTAMSLAVVPYGRRRPVDRKPTWGEAMVGTVYVFFTMFLAFGVVPHQFIVHADNELGWRKDKFVNGPFDLLVSQANGGSFPFSITYEAVRDIVVIVIHVFYVGLMIWLFAWRQKRGEMAETKPAVQSAYGRPLVKKG